MYVKLFDNNNFKLVAQTKLDQLGSDPRAKILAKLILEDIKEANPHIRIDEEKEISHIISHCVQLLSSLSPIIRNSITLSTGIKTDYKIRRAHLEDRLMYNRGIEDKVLPQLESIISNNGLTISSVDIVLLGDELNTNYFKDTLTRKFANVSGFSSLIDEKLLKRMLADVSMNNYSINAKVLRELPKNPIVDSRGVSQIIQKTNTEISKPQIKVPRVFETPPILNTPPVIKAPPIPPIPVIPVKHVMPVKQVNSNLENKQVPKPEIKAPPIIKPEFKLPPVMKEVKQVEVSPLPPRAKVPPPPPPPPIKKK